MLPARFCRLTARRSRHLHTAHNVSTQRESVALNAIIGDASYATPSPTGLLAGKHIAIKDNIVTTVPLPTTTAASKTLDSYHSPFEATVVQLLRQNGAHISSKSNLDEFGMGSHSQHSFSGATISSFLRGGVHLSPGGSSGGSAVAVATGQAWAALGTDTGGSVRLPAAYTSVVGFKPSYGMVSRWGVVQYANSLDTVGILGKRVEDVRRVFEAIEGWDGKDPTSLSVAFRERIKKRPMKTAGGERKEVRLRVGVPLEYNIHEFSPVVRHAYIRTLHRLQSHGHSLHPISLPTTRSALSAYYVLAPAEASSNLAKYDGVRYGHRSTSGPDARPKENLPLYAATRGEGFGEEVKRRILLGAYTLSSDARENYFAQAQRVRRLVQQDFDRAFALRNPLLHDHDVLNSLPPELAGGGVVDVLLTPTAPTLPPTVEEVKRLTPVENYMNDVFTVPASLAGLPAVSVPVALDEGERKGLEETDVRSVGLQVVGQFGDDDRVLQVAELLEGLAEM